MGEDQENPTKPKAFFVIQNCFSGTAFTFYLRSTETSLWSLCKNRRKWCILPKTRWSPFSWKVNRSQVPASRRWL